MSDSTDQSSTPPLQTPLHRAHLERDARMVPFAGYDMPVQYKTGILEEHAWTRTAASVFDISHMGQAQIIADDGRHETAAAALEALAPADFVNLQPGRQRYTQLLNENGGVIDDLMVTRPADPAESGRLLLVLNAARKSADCAHLARNLDSRARIEIQPELALIALQGPTAGAVLETMCPRSAELLFMQATRARIGALDVHIARSGYTGEDGFEISVAADEAPTLWNMLLANDGVRPCGLGARDSLRLEAGLCLYGHELDEATSPIEASLLWSIPPRRRAQGGFPGNARIRREIAEGPERIRVGIAVDGRAPARDGAKILNADSEEIGVVTSGGFSPTLKRPIALGFVPPAYASLGTTLKLLVRSQLLDGHVVKLPFVPHQYRRAN